MKRNDASDHLVLDCWVSLRREHDSFLFRHLEPQKLGLSGLKTREALCSGTYSKSRLYLCHSKAVLVSSFNSNMEVMKEPDDSLPKALRARSVLYHVNNVPLYHFHP